MHISRKCNNLLLEKSIKTRYGSSKPLKICQRLYSGNRNHVEEDHKEHNTTNCELTKPKLYIWY